MRRWKSAVIGLSLLGAGYLLGSFDAFEARPLTAQEPELSVAKDTAEKIRAADLALREASDALRSEGRYESATDSVNAFLVMCGGGDARADLESGTGVDPETFAALYAGQAIPDIADLLDRDEENRLTYNGQVVRMYSKARLQRLYAERTKIAESKF
jgi:hypothetical protein